jgi:hypothetical protein
MSNTASVLLKTGTFYSFPSVSCVSGLSISDHLFYCRWYYFHDFFLFQLFLYQLLLEMYHTIMSVMTLCPGGGFHVKQMFSWQFYSIDECSGHYFIMSCPVNICHGQEHMKLYLGDRILYEKISSGHSFIMKICPLT